MPSWMGERVEVAPVVAPLPTVSEPSAADLLPQQPPSAAPRWHQEYVRRLAVTDTVAVVVALAGAQLVRFGVQGFSVNTRALDGELSEFSYTLVSVMLGVLWLASLSLYRTRGPRMVGEGAEEYRRLADASLRLFGLVAIVALVFRMDFARGYLFLAFPAGVLLLFGSRWLQRKWLMRRRAEGGYCARVLVVGGRRSVASVARSFARDSAGGYTVVGCCVPGFTGQPGETFTIDGAAVPMWGDESAVIAALQACGADTVAVAATDQLGHEGMRELAWDLHSLDVDMVVAPGVVDVAGPRLTMRPVAGLPLLHVEEPQFLGASKVGKLVFDVVVATIALVVTSPVVLVAVVAIKATSRGPVLYRSERVGLNGESFGMLKLRTMDPGADSRVVELVGLDVGSGPLFKVRNDPRVTPVGKVLRKYSVDELPQFLNVLRREMSVVGPRPPLRREVNTYNGQVRRRLLVKPGITGLWQVSGRSDLVWEEAVRLDLYYVENWSMVQDLQIVVRTLRAVVRGKGAY